MTDPKRKGLAVIIASKIPPPDRLKSSRPRFDSEAGADEGEGDEGEGDMGKVSAAEDLISAVKDGNAKAVIAAFEDLYAMCGEPMAKDDSESE